VFHVLNRRAGAAALFEGQADYQAFEQILAEAHERVRMRTLAYCLVPTHWHLVVWPRGDGDLSEFLRWVSVTHAQRWHAAHGTVGTGPLYQGRYKSFPIQKDEHLLTLCRYVERSAVRARLVRRAERWRWSSLWRREFASPEEQAWLSAWPVARPKNWLPLVNAAQTQAAEEAVGRCLARSRPFGTDRWTARMARRLGLERTLRPRGRPRKHKP